MFEKFSKSLAVAPNGKVHFGTLVSTIGHLNEYNPVGNTFSDKGAIQGQGPMNSLAVGPNSTIFGGSSNQYNGGNGCVLYLSK